MKRKFYVLCYLIITIPSFFTNTGVAKEKALNQNVILKDTILNPAGVDFILNEIYQPGYRHRQLEKIIVGVSGPKRLGRDRNWYQTETDKIVSALTRHNIQAINLWRITNEIRSPEKLREYLEDYDGMLSLEINNVNDRIGIARRPKACNNIETIETSNDLMPKDFFYAELYSRFPGESLWVSYGCSRARDNISPEATLNSLPNAIVQKLIEKKLLKN